MFLTPKISREKAAISPHLFCCGLAGKGGSFKSGRGGVGQGRYWDDLPLGCSVMLLHLLFVPKIEKSNILLPASIAFVCPQSLLDTCFGFLSHEPHHMKLFLLCSEAI